MPYSDGSSKYPKTGFWKNADKQWDPSKFLAKNEGKTMFHCLKYDTAPKFQFRVANLSLRMITIPHTSYGDRIEMLYNKS